MLNKKGVFDKLHETPGKEEDTQAISDVFQHPLMTIWLEIDQLEHMSKLMRC